MFGLGIVTKPLKCLMGAGVSSYGFFTLLYLGPCWIVQILDESKTKSYETEWALRPRQSLIHIFSAPFVHSTWMSLVVDSAGFSLKANFVMWSRGKLEYLCITSFIIAVGGFGTWMITPGNTQIIGSSSIIFGLWGFLLSMVIWNCLHRNIQWKSIIAAVITGIVYGILLFEVSHTGMRWEYPFCGAVAGVVAALFCSWYRKVKDAPPEEVVTVYQVTDANGNIIAETKDKPLLGPAKGQAKGKSRPVWPPPQEDEMRLATSDSLGQNEGPEDYAAGAGGGPAKLWPPQASPQTHPALPPRPGSFTAVPGEPPP